MDPNESTISQTQSQVPQTADGTLVIIVCRAKHLPNRRKLDKQSPYVTLRLGTVAKKTPSHFRAGQTPDWTHEVRFELSREKKPLLKLDVLDETKNDPTPIGTCDIDCSVIFQDENNKNGKYIHDKWYDLTLNGRRAGVVYLEMTFYPSAPVLPPKLYEADYETESMRGSQTQFRSSTSSYGSNKGLPPPPPANPTRNPSVIDDVFVSSADSKRRSLFHLSHESSASSAPKVEADTDEVFVTGPEKKNKYFEKFNKFKTKFSTKEPITTLWNHEPSNEERVANLSPIDIKELDNLDDLQKDMQFNSPRPFSGDKGYDSPRGFDGAGRGFDSPRGFDGPRGFNSPGGGRGFNGPRGFDGPQAFGDEISFESPPSPPTHSEASINMFPTSVRESSPPSPARSAVHSKPLRKPPPELGLKKNHLKSPTTSIPYSADSIGLEDEEDKRGLPTKVYFMDKQVKSLSYSSLPNPPEPVNKDEIDPRYYAPTPNEHFTKSRQQERRPLDVKNQDSGYLGDGKWENKFSPSIFDRIPVNDNDENHGFKNKPHIPPKIPRGLSEQEYYVLEKEKYLRDINGNRT